jgi:N4-(beta-N-acetylglucosaminyl)-L-asparaginase
MTEFGTSSGSARPSRRAVLGAAGALPLLRLRQGAAGAKRPVMVGSTNALAGMKLAYPRLLEGADPLDAAIQAVKVVEADPSDHSVGLGGLPDERGIVTLDAACMDGVAHKSGAVAAIENILHPSEVARLVLERTDHCLLVGKGAYDFARAHGHPHVELLTDEARAMWLEWKERLSTEDDWLPPPPKAESEKHGSRVPGHFDRYGTVHCSVLSSAGEVACTTTTSGLAYKIHGRVGDSPIIGAGLYCDQEAGSAGATGRGEASILCNGSFLLVELLRSGMPPREAGLEVLKRIVRQVQRQAKVQPELMGNDGTPSFSIQYYALDLQGRFAGVTLRGSGTYAVADPDGGPRTEPLVPLLP